MYGREPLVIKLKPPSLCFYITFYKHILLLFIYSKYYWVYRSLADSFLSIHDHMYGHNALSFTFLLRYSFPRDCAIIRRSYHSFPSFELVGKVFEAAARRRKLSRARTIDHQALEAIFVSNTNSAASFLRRSEAYKKHRIMLCEIRMNHHPRDEVENLSLHLYASREISIF